ncbi:hypothetical protein [Sphingomonas sp. BK580]|uniref:hypothetical protein n=1 Tax=Sphingomonas sp. BK580 TaxID=2586972 RepID=UPI00160AB2AA|nr:hypothetical protein [Sphingomonas sp. BK580]MBB3693045.1 hypothetical protein [Sphingomonas sp. BK580]
MLIPAAYAATLAAVREVFPGALIAGGALRDLDNGREVKDLDIFAPNVPDLDTFRALAARFGVLLSVMGGYESWATAECVGVIDLQIGDQPFQLIGLRSGPETILPRLDFGICRIGFDGSEVIRTDEYLADQATQTFTLLRADDDAQRDRSLRRFDRLSAKYPGWKLFDPDAPDLVTF